MPLDIVILAAGQGKRMNSALPKVLHTLAGRPLLAHVLDTARALGPRALHTVIGHGAEQVRKACAADDVRWVLQAEQHGTGHAVRQAAPGLADEGVTLVLYGDVPLVTEASLRALTEAAATGTLALLTVELADPSGYGRIVRDGARRVTGIVEDKDADAAQRAIREINTGIMAIPTARLRGWLGRLQNDNSQREYYLTDIVAMAVADGVAVQAFEAASAEEVAGVNDRAQLAVLERAFQRASAQALMAAGVGLADPARFDLRGRLRHGRDVLIDINVVLEGEIELGDGVHIGPGCVLRDTRLGANVHVLPHCVIEGADIGAGCSIGPFARLRPGTRMAQGAKIGNFVETKKSTIGAGSKISHLSYVGDTVLGERVNVGAGTITCNYDGVNKFETRIGDGVFIGSNTALVAPVEVGRDATIAAGSVITSTVPEGSLAVARGRQRNIEGWQKPRKKS